MDMVWRTSMGERGRLQTSSLQRMAPGYGDLRLTIEKIPATVKLPPNSTTDFSLELLPLIAGLQVRIFLFGFIVLHKQSKT
ncbi:unnamed protein product [Gongylonema pulchrum]|uniref:Trafficking protein particle complex subunit 13 middle domain-containing protein n=1 Tax=Gongylonema pulchrum TaxID=637853 RepID=A0A3P7NKK4_9BILA|nr:unnamed protein product [Gongylonema pulchrum]